MKDVVDAAKEAVAEITEPPRKMRVDMHMHTEYSPDSRSKLADLAAAVADAGLDAVCVTDHNTIEGALRLREMGTTFRVIVGEEIYSADGEIIGLFLEQAVPPHLPADETIDRIHAQGGLAYIPHPFSRNRTRHMSTAHLVRLRDKIDAIEVFNAREVFAGSNTKALLFAKEHGLPGGVGSDSHRLAEIGRAYKVVEPFETPQELVESLRGGDVTGRLAGVGMHFRTFLDIGRKLVGRRR